MNSTILNFKTKLIKSLEEYADDDFVVNDELLKFIDDFMPDNNREKIALVWGIDDVQNMAIKQGYYFDDTTLCNILQDVEHGYDCNHGVSWDTLTAYINNHVTGLIKQNKAVPSVILEDFSVRGCFKNNPKEFFDYYIAVIPHDVDSSDIPEEIDANYFYYVNDRSELFELMKDISKEDFYLTEIEGEGVSIKYKKAKK